MTLVSTAHATSSARTDSDRAIKLALDDERVQTRLRLRSLDTRAVPASSAPDQWQVELHANGAVYMRALVDLRTEDVIRVSGQTLFVMPGVRTYLLEVITSWWMQLPLLVLFLVGALAPVHRSARRVLAPLVGMAGCSVIILLDLIPVEQIRLGNLLLYGITTALLVAGAWIWMCSSRSVPPDEPFAVRGSASLWGGVACAGIALQAFWGSRIQVPIDVAFASDGGARLMAGGARVYGNMIDLPGFLVLPDTYGPMAYLAYVPGVTLLDNPRNAVLVTNLTLSAVTALVLYATGRRIATSTSGAWMAAVWTTCPFVATGVSAGNNDVVIGLLVALAMLTLHRPAWRAAAIAAAGAVKYLPLAAAFAMFRQRDEPRRATAIALGAGIATLIVLLTIGVHDLDGLRIYLDRAFGYQLGRDDIASAWGLGGISNARYVPLLAAGVLALASAWLVRRSSPVIAAACTASTMALALAGLPQLWPAYVTWIVPAVLVLAVQVSSKHS